MQIISIFSQCFHSDYKYFTLSTVYTCIHFLFVKLLKLYEINKLREAIRFKVEQRMEGARKDRHATQKTGFPRLFQLSYQN